MCKRQFNNYKFQPISPSELRNTIEEEEERKGIKARWMEGNSRKSPSNHWYKLTEMQPASRRPAQVDTCPLRIYWRSQFTGTFEFSWDSWMCESVCFWFLCLLWALFFLLIYLIQPQCDVCALSLSYYISFCMFCCYLLEACFFFSNERKKGSEYRWVES